MGDTVRRIVRVAAPVVGAAFGPVGAVLGGAAGGLAGGGGLKSALIGGLTGGLGSAVSGATGALSSTGSSLSSGLRSALSGGRSILGTVAGTPLAGGVGPTQGSGLLGSLTRGLSGGASQAIGSLARSAPDLLSAFAANDTQDDIKKSLIAQQQRSEELFKPYTTSGHNALNTLNNFDQTALENDPGYKFRLSQGEQALNRAQSASGNLYSGQALKAAQEYGQGVADQTYNDAFGRNFQLAEQGRLATGAQAGVYDNIGNIQANSKLAKNNILTGALSNALTGNKTIVGYKDDGTPIYQ